MTKYSDKTMADVAEECRTYLEQNGAAVASTHSMQVIRTLDILGYRIMDKKGGE